MKEYMKANEELNQNREKLKACDEQISALVREQATLKQELADCIVKIKRLDNEVCFSMQFVCLCVCSLSID